MHLKLVSCRSSFSPNRCWRKAHAKSKTVRLLAVGNSFSHKATHYRGEISKENGEMLILCQDNIADQTHSLNVGWNWRKQGSRKLTLGMDCHHANVVGDHLGAWIGTLSAAGATTW